MTIIPYLLILNQKTTLRKHFLLNLKIIFVFLENKMLLAFLSSLDLFQNPIKFYFNGRSKLFSSFGIFVSFSIYAFLLFSFINSDLFKKEEPIIITQSLQMPQAEPINFSSNIILTFAMVNILGVRLWDPSYFSIDAKYYTSTSTFVEKQLKSCAIEPNNQKERMGTNLNNTRCLLNDTFSLEGSTDDSIFRYLTISLSPCDNKTSNNTCKSAKEINEYIDAFPLTNFFAIRYHDAKTDLNNYESPFEWNSEIEMQYINSKVQRNMMLYFKNAEIETDDGWFLPSKKTLKDIMLDKKTSDFRLRAQENEPFFKIFLLASKDKYISSRRYKKLPEVLAEISGLAQFFIMIFGVVAKIVIYIGTLNKVLNKLYVFPRVNKKTKKREKKVAKNTSKKIETEESPIKTTVINNTENKETILCTNNNNIINTVFENKTSLCEIFFNKNTNNNKEEVIEKKEIFIEIAENKGSLNQLKPKILIDDPITSEIFSEENKIKPDIQKNEENFSNNEIELKKATNSRKISESLSGSSLKNLCNANIEEKNRKKSLFSKISPSSRKKLSNQAPKINLEKIKTSQNAENFKLTILNYLHYSWCKLLRVFFKKKLSKFHQIIEQAEIFYIKDMDSMNMVQKNHDLEKLKMLVLNEDQLVLFNFLSKPIISSSYNELNEVDSAKFKESNKKVTDLIKKQNLAGDFFDDAYGRVMKNEENNEINKRLIQFLDREIKKLN